jgi:diaminopimelate epimerase
VIPFTKAHACGNDFLIVECRHAGEAGRRETAQRLCARNTGVGADGIEYFDWTGERSGRITLYNADGSVAEISGNGTRCVAAWMAHVKRAGKGDTLTIETEAGVRECRIIAGEDPHFEILSRMGVPTVEARSVTIAGGERVEGAVVSTGNPHFVIFVDNAEFVAHGRAWQVLGDEICRHGDFPRQTNVEFVHILNPGDIEIRIFERGVGPTTSSGTGTCATSSASMALRGVSRKLSVRAPGGTQQVEWADAASEILLTGPATLVAEGEAW